MTLNMEEMTDREFRLSHPCPLCKVGKVQLLTDAIIEEEMLPAFHIRGHKLPTRLRLCNAIACNTCEFMEEA